MNDVARPVQHAADRGPGPRRHTSGVLIAAVDRASSFAAGAVLGAAVLGFGGGLYWTLDLFAHEQRVYAVLLFGLGVTFAFRRRWIWFGVIALGLAFTVFRLAPLYVASPEPASVGASELAIVSTNVLSTNDDHAAAAHAVREAGADVVVVMEVDAEWIDALAARLPDFRLLVAEARRDTFGIALFARADGRGGVEAVDARAVELTDTSRRLPSIEAELRIDGTDVALLAVHPPPPIGARNAADNRATLEAVAAWSKGRRDAGVPHVVVGDLNATPWSAAFRDLVRATGLVNSQHGFGFGASWPVGVVSTFGLGIPIDHALHSPELTTLDRTLGPDIGSDHYPLRFVVTWRDGSDHD